MTTPDALVAKRHSVWRLPPSQTPRILYQEAQTFASPGERGPLLVDLSKTTVLDGRTLQILIALAADALQKGRHFEIVNALPQVAGTLHLAGVGYLLGD